MQRLNKRRIAFLCALIFLGLLGMVGGLYTVISADDVYQKSSASLISPLVNSTTPRENLSDSKIQVAEAEFQTNYAFCVNNPLNFTIAVAVNNPDQFDKIIAIPWMVAKDAPYPTTAEVISSIKSGLYFENVTLNRNLNDNTFSGTKINYIFTNEGNIGFFLIPYTKETARGGILMMENDPFIIYPETAKFQAQTNKIIQLQNIESTRSNSHIEGLTFIIMGLVPLGLFVEAIIHRHITEYGRSNVS